MDKGSVLKKCKKCGAELEWKHPYLEGHVMMSSDNIEDYDTCRSCISEHCNSTICFYCKNYERKKRCKFLYLKEEMSV